MKKLTVMLLVLAVILLPTALLAQTPQPGDPPPGSPDVWTASVCAGENAGVYQPRDNSGTGVTLSLYDPWGCPEVLTPNQVLFFPEPYPTAPKSERVPGFENDFNEDSGCYTNTWSEAQTFGRRTGLLNGSFWISPATLANNPIVVHCSTVMDQDDLGLNPNEGQIERSRIDWVNRRHAELLAAASQAPAPTAVRQDGVIVVTVTPVPTQAPMVVTATPSPQAQGVIIVTATPAAGAVDIAPPPANSTTLKNPGSGTTVPNWVMILIVVALIALAIVATRFFRPRPVVVQPRVVREKPIKDSDAPYQPRPRTERPE